jgi:transglutaminase-like putative cysteine protease
MQRWLAAISAHPRTAGAVGAAVVAAGVAAAAAVMWAWPGQDAPAWRERELVYLFEARNTTAERRTDGELAVFVPPDIAGRQKRVELVSEAPVDVETAAGGNTLAHIELGAVPPYGVRQVRLRIRLEVAEHSSGPAWPDGVESPGRFPVDDRRIRDAVERVSADSARATAEAIHQWVGEHIDDVGYVARDRGALYALEQGRGDCTEFMSLATTLALAAGLEARGVAGFDYERDQVAKASEFHNWTEVAVDGRWWVLDAQKDVFIDRVDGHIVVRRLTAATTQSASTQGIFQPIEGFDIRML